MEYVRNFSKRVRKKDSAVILASQNLEDFNLDGVREYTKPLFSIPTHQFLFNAGSIDAKFYIDKFSSSSIVLVCSVFIFITWVFSTDTRIIIEF